MAGVAEAGLRRDAIGLREVLLAFAGLETAAPLAEERRAPGGRGTARSSALRYFLRRGRQSLTPVRQLLLPVLGIAAFAPGLLTAAGLPVSDCVTELIAPVSYAGPMVGIWMAAGLVVLVVLRRWYPGRIAETARVHLGEPAPTDPAQNGATHR